MCFLRGDGYIYVFGGQTLKTVNSLVVAVRGLPRQGLFLRYSVASGFVKQCCHIVPVQWTCLPILGHMS